LVYEHIGPTIEAYVDDIVFKTKKVSNLVDNLDVAFKCLKAKNIRINPEKCVFGVPRGMLLGFIVSERGIEANPEKIIAITKMGPIQDLKGVQRVTGCLAALGRFISRLGEKALPLYRLLKKLEHFSWTLEDEEALTQGNVIRTSNTHPSGCRRISLALRHRDDTSGQRGHSHREGGRRSRVAYLENSILCL
jgi:hypothetical protein